MKKRLLAGLVIAGLGVVSNALPSFAGSATNILTINATVAGGCVVSPALLSFGSLSAGSSASLDQEANINVLCTNGINPSSISLTPAVGGRKLTSANPAATNLTSKVDYELYTTAERTTVWNTTNTVDPNAAPTIPGFLTVGDSNTPLKVYGRISHVPDSALVGAYAGAETITVTY